MIPALDRSFLDMSRRFNGNNASFLARGARTAAHSTHGVVCASRECRVFDPNVLQKHEGIWRCENHGGANNHARANARDEEFSNGIPGAERRARFARFRAKQKQPKAKTYTGHIPSFLDKPQKIKAKAPKVQPQIERKTDKQKQREAAMQLLGLCEADLNSFLGQ
tara:strand:- start:816 stop:1310 length:495 start_codon:yes stop_codon:yes gene_type:complete